MINNLKKHVSREITKDVKMSVKKTHALSAKLTVVLESPISCFSDFTITHVCRMT